MSLDKDKFFINVEKMRRADNNNWETAQNGVEYFAPDQQGGIYGIIYRRFYDIPDGAGLGATVNITIGETIVQAIQFVGWVLELSSNKLLSVPFGWSDPNFGIFMDILATRQTIEIPCGASMDHQGGKCWLDYTR